MWPGRSDGVDLSQPGLGCNLERSWRGGRAASLGHLILHEKPLGAVLMPSLILVCVLPKRAPAAFFEKPGPLHFLGCPRTGTGVCCGGGRDQVDMPKVMPKHDQGAKPPRSPA